MAGLALLFARDGSPADSQRLARMAQRLAYRGSAIAIWCEGPIALAQTGPPASSPAVAATPDGRWRLIFDGRLDNRAELARELDAAPLPQARDDASLAALACARWREQAAARLRGDFAAAAWDRDTRQVILIRDVRGLRPLYLRLEDRELCCASDLQTLAREGDRAPNEGMIAEWLTGAPASHSDTVYAGIARLPMAHVATVTADTAADSQYWTPSIDPAMGELPEGDRAALFTTILRDAVRDRSVPHRPAVLLSGGLDSSSVAAMLAESGPVDAFTLAQESPQDDEHAYASLVANHLDSTHTIIRGGAVSIDDAAAEATRWLDVPPPPNGVQSLALRAAIVAGGHASAISGLGSDEWFGGSFLLYADLARSGALVELARTIWADRDRDEPSRVRLQLAAWALCPPWLKPPLRGMFGGDRAIKLVSPVFARRTSLTDRLRSVAIAPPPLPTLAQQALYRDTTGGAYVAATEMQERGNAYAGLEERYPFHDRRVIEFSLGLPESDRWAGGHYKGVIRRAMAGRLPAAVIERQVSPNANNLLAATLRTAGRRFFERLEIADAGWVDRGRVLAAWDAFERRPGSEAWDLWAVAAIELWSRHALAGRTSATGGRTSVA